MKLWRIAFMMFAAFSLASCSSNDSEQEKPFTVCPEEQIKFFACEKSSETRGATASIDTLFTEDDIEWFNVSTREIRFKKQGELLYMKLKKNYHKEGLEFRLGENVLFEVSRFVSDFDSRIFTDLVLHYSMIGENEGHPRYYLDDCYPLQFVDTDEVKANIKKNAGQWELFIYYLESKGKLKK